MKGFTIIELIISVAIFAVMTALVIARYGSFNQNTLVTNMAYDLAITVRTAQTYGVSVKSVEGDTYNSAYGIHFDLSKNTKFTFFADKNTDGIYDQAPLPGDEDITAYNLTQGATIEFICLGPDYNQACSGSGYTKLMTGTFDVTYRRPNPNAYFYVNGSLDPDQVVFISIKSSDGQNSRSVVIRKNGQISVENNYN
jgi:prepilin-type N-terminal cleavage/methylation domain-containing protein